MRRQIPLALCFIAGLFMAVQYFIPHPAVQNTYELLLGWLQTLLAFAFLLGTVSLIRMHFHKIRNRADDRAFSWVTLLGLLEHDRAGLHPPSAPASGLAL